MRSRAALDQTAGGGCLHVIFVAVVNFGYSKFTAAKFTSSVWELIRPERTVSIRGCGSIDGGEYTSVVEEGKSPVESACRRRSTGHRSRQVAKRRIAGVGSGYVVEIVHAEIDRVRRRIIIRVHIGCRKRRGRGGAIPRVVVTTNIRQVVDLREEIPVRAAVNEAAGKGPGLRS